MTDLARSDRALPRALLFLALAGMLAGGGLLAGCGGLGLPGTGDPDPGQRYPSETAVTGEVVRVDTGARRIELDDAGRRHTVAYETTTPVYFEGRTYSPSDLERGDIIRARVTDDRARIPVADRIDVVESVRSGPARDGGYDDPAGAVHADVSGEIDRVDPDRREIVVRTSRGDQLVTYDDRTRVFYQGREYEPVNLERGDLVEIDTATRSGSRYAVAERIDVTQAVQDRTDYRDDPYATGRQLSGTVDWIDARRGEFGLRTDRETVTVEVPFDAANATRDRFTRLQRGDRIRVEVEERDRSRVELIQFL